MGSFTLTAVDRFPTGTSVSVYLAEGAKQGQAPSGSAVTSGTMGSSSLTFSGLEDYREYVAYASVGGVHRYSGFRAQPDAERQYGDRGRLDALESNLDLAESGIEAISVNAASRGVLPGLGDKSSEWADLVAEVMDAGGGTIVFPKSDQPYRIDSFTIPNDGAAHPKQSPLRIVGHGGYVTGRIGNGYAPDDGVVIDLGGNSGPAKIDTRGDGLLMLEGLTFREPSAATTKPFLQTTNTAVIVERCGFVGHSSKQTTSCDQDAIYLGGGNTIPYGEGGANQAFQGYGTVIKDCFFDRVRRCVYGRRASNDVIVQGNTVSNKCGTNLAGGAAIDFEGGSAGGDEGVYGAKVLLNTIEVTGYVYGVKLAYSFYCNVLANGCYDPGGSAVAAVRVENALGNTIISGFHQGIAALSEGGPLYGRNQLIDYGDAGSQLHTLALRSMAAAGASGEALLEFWDHVNVKQAQLRNNGKTWEGRGDTGVGANLTIDTTAGTPTTSNGGTITHKATRHRFEDTNGTEQAAIIARGGGSPSLWVKPVTGVGARPAASTVGEGGIAFDANYDRPIFSDGTSWRYADDFNRTAKSANYTIGAGDTMIAITATASAITLTLPAISAVPSGRLITVKDESGGAGTNNITVQRAGSDTIEGGTSKAITTNYGVLRLYSNGTQWFVI